MSTAPLSDDLDTAVAQLPEPVADFFRRILAHQDYDCRAGRMQMMISFRGQKVGGLNRRASHWYLSKVFVREHGKLERLKAYGFKHVVKNDEHDYWAAGRKRVEVTSRLEIDPV